MMQINKHVHAIKVPFYITIPPSTIIERFVYVYLIYGTKGVCLIDTGIASSEEAIFNYLRKTDRRVEDISLVIQTHSHPDHIGSTRTIKAESRCSVAAHPQEKAWIENVQLQATERPVPGFDLLVAGPVPVDRLLEDGEVFDLGCGLKLEIFKLEMLHKASGLPHLCEAKPSGVRISACCATDGTILLAVHLDHDDQLWRGELV